MTKHFQPDQPKSPPQPVSISLPDAIRAAIAHGNCINDPELKLERWGETYRHEDGTPRTEAEIRALWESIAGEGIEPPLHVQVAGEITDE